MSVTPDFVGQIYKDTVTGNLWRANSTTAGDWTLELQNAQLEWSPTSAQLGEKLFYALNDNNTFTSIVINGSACGGIQIDVDFVLQTLSGPSLLTIGDQGYAPMYIDNCDVLASVDFPVLTDIQDELNLTTIPLLTTVSLPELETCALVTINSVPSLASLNLNSFTSCTAGVFTIDVSSPIASISLPAFIAAGGGADTTISGGASLATLSMPSWVPVNGSQNFFNDNALLAASVNQILARGVANAGFVTGRIDLDGGTNAAPTGQGIVDKATLIGRGVTVNTN